VIRRFLNFVITLGGNGDYLSRTRGNFLDIGHRFLVAQYRVSIVGIFRCEHDNRQIFVD
jgi:hypothetical protein